MGIPLDDGQHKGVVGHDEVDVVGMLGDSIGVCDGEWDEIKSLILYESRWDIQCKDVAGDSVLTSDFIRLDGGTVSMATKGGFISLWHGEAELGVGNWPNRNIWQIRSSGAGRWRALEGVDIDGGFRTSWFQSVNVDGCGVTLCIRFLGGGGRGGMTDTSLRVCPSQFCSILVRSVVRVSIHSCISTRVIWHSLANLCNSTNSCVFSEIHNSSDDGSTVSWIINLRCYRFIACKIASSCFHHVSWKCCWCEGFIRHGGQVWCDEICNG